MKRQYWTIGVFLSLGVSFIGALPKLLRAESFEWSSFFISITYTECFSLLCWFLLYYLKESNYLSRKFSNKFIYGFLSVFIVGLLSLPYNQLFSETITEALQLRNVAPDRKIFVVLLRGWVIGGFYYFILYFLHSLEEKQKHKLEIEQLKQAQLKAKLASLKEQISPHFLFNTLNTLSTLSKEDVVKEFVSELANVYRYVLTYKDDNTATLSQELNFIQSYLYIIKTRLEDSIEITIYVESEMLNSQIPPLTLQILIENAIKHNVAAMHRPLKISIFNNDNELIIKNNLQPKQSVSHSTGIGLDNIAQRYKIIFGREITIVKYADAFLVKLPIVNL